MSLSEWDRTQWLPEPRLSRRLRHARIHGPLLPRANPNRVQSSLGPADEHHFSEMQGLSRSQEGGHGRRAEDAAPSPLSGNQIREPSVRGNDDRRQAIPDHHGGLSGDDVGRMRWFESFRVLLGDVYEEVHLAVSLTMRRLDTTPIQRGSDRQFHPHSSMCFVVSERAIVLFGNQNSSAFIAQYLCEIPIVTIVRVREQGRRLCALEACNNNKVHRRRALATNNNLISHIVFHSVMPNGQQASSLLSRIFANWNIRMHRTPPDGSAQQYRSHDLTGGPR